jgi:two-component system NtrC family sensor kinase
MMSMGTTIGVIVVSRTNPSSFSAHHIQLLQTFADQAVIAIENVRLFNETQEALERQTATASVLQVISESMADSAPVFESILDSCEKLFPFTSAGIALIDSNNQIQLQATRGPGTRILWSLFPQPLDSIFGQAISGLQPLYTANVAESERTTDAVRLAAKKVAGYSMLQVPMIWQGRGIGSINVSRLPNVTFSEKEVTLLKTFADQAVIAIQNARLFNETQEALERQTATADILKVIASSPSNVQPVFEAIAERSNRLVDGLSTAVYSIVDDTLHLMAFTRASPEADAALQASFPRPMSEAIWADQIRRGQIGEVIDAEVDWAEQPALLELARLRGFRSLLLVPLVRDRVTIGQISVTRRETGRFAAHHIQLLQTFADQAVIAIGNVQLFDEVQARTRDLTEALTYQTGSSNILSVIASSPTDVGPVLQAIVESACGLCQAYDAIVLLKDGDHLRFSAHHGPLMLEAERWPINRNWTSGRAFLERRPVHVRDLLSDEGNDFPDAQELSRRGGTSGLRSILAVPLLREGESIGAIVLRRIEVHPFSDKQISLLQTFADQAVIAIGNVQLFDEVQAKTRDLSESLQQQTATADVLKVISRSAFDLQTVLDTLVESAGKLCNTTMTNIWLRDGDVLRSQAQMGLSETFSEFLRAHPIARDRGKFVGRAFLTGELVHMPDVLADPEYTFVEAPAIGQFRSALGVPLIRQGQVEGVFALVKPEPGGFTDREIELVRTFADQAMIAIENVRLFDEVQARTKELAASLDDLRTAQDRLVQTEKLASLGQLTAGIAHEIKNPLNFVNNFSALSVELTDELNDLLKPAPLDAKMRGDLDELTGLIKANLEKVVQHGKRADSIVKNMLLHSREGSGEQRSTDINALLDESLNLAYHGARAEKPGFNITLQRDFDATAGSVEGFPQEITRAFLNLISNGFYAATKRHADNGEASFEPQLIAATKDLGGQVEIRIRDNGTGIPAEVREKMFNPFFTTKPAGEGTGLGLSMSHDIIVKQHGGRIDVATEPGQFTEFTILLPRTIRR